MHSHIQAAAARAHIEDLHRVAARERLAELHRPTPLLLLDRSVSRLRGALPARRPAEIRAKVARPVAARSARLG